LNKSNSKWVSSLRKWQLQYEAATLVSYLWAIYFFALEFVRFTLILLPKNLEIQMFDFDFYFYCCYLGLKRSDWEMERNWIGVDVEEVSVLFRFLSSPSFFSSRCKIFSHFFCVLLCFSFSIFFYRSFFFMLKKIKHDLLHWCVWIYD
jgi:hypothetical protein